MSCYFNISSTVLHKCQDWDNKIKYHDIVWPDNSISKLQQYSGGWHPTWFEMGLNLDFSSSQFSHSGRSYQIPKRPLSSLRSNATRNNHVESTETEVHQSGGAESTLPPAEYKGEHTQSNSPWTVTLKLIVCSATWLCDCWESKMMDYASMLKVGGSLAKWRCGHSLSLTHSFRSDLTKQTGYAWCLNIAEIKASIRTSRTVLKAQKHHSNAAF